jgi:hypothetical protein
MTKRGAAFKPKDDNWVTVRRGHFSRLYFKNQEKRRGLDNLGSLEKTDYEGRRYVVPEEALNDTISFEEIDNKLKHAWQNLKKQNPLNTEEDIRLLREMQWNQEGSDYEYRFWLQNEVEKTWTGQRSLKILMSLNNELNAAQETWNALSIDFAKELSEFIDHLVEIKLQKDHALNTISNQHKDSSKLELKEIFEPISPSKSTLSKQINDNTDSTESIQIDLTEYFDKTQAKHEESKKIIKSLSKTTIKVLFQTINKTQRTRADA